MTAGGVVWRSSPDGGSRVDVPGDGSDHLHTPVLPWIPFKSGLYFFCTPTSATGTSATLGIGTLLVAPFWVPADVSLTRIGVEVTGAGDAGRSVSDMVTNGTTTVTSATAAFVAGDVGRLVTGDNIPSGTYVQSRTNATTAVLTQAATGSGTDGSLTISGAVVRLGIFRDTGSGYPGALALDAGTIDGNSATVQEITIAQTLTAGLYWAGAAVQGVTSVQPTLRTVGTSGGYQVGTGSIPSANIVLQGYSHASVSVALPSTFASSVTSAASVPRIFVKTA